MPTIPLDQDPDRPDFPAAPSAAAPSPADEHPVDLLAPDEIPPAERMRLRDRRTGLIALVVVTIALWACIAAAVGFATTM